MTGTGPVCVAFALPREAMYFRRAFPPTQRFRAAPCPAYLAGRPPSAVLVLEMGMGPRSADRALTWALGADGPGPAVVVSAGFSGGLRPGLTVGDLILADEVVAPEGQRWPTAWPGPSVSGPWRRGRVLAVSAVVADPGAKARLGRTHEAEAVDMESATVAATCSRHGIPFGCLRVLSDDWRTPLSPQLAQLLAGGQVTPLRVLAAIVRTPGLMREMIRLARDTRQAAGRLAEGLDRLLAGAAVTPPREG